MMTVRCYLAPSLIEGLGVYCHDPIRKGDVIWRFDPRFDRLIPIEDFQSAAPSMQEFLERYTYEMDGHPGFLVLDVDEGRFMNHSDAPNTDFNAPHIGLALRDIDPGEELTCDYACFTVGDIVFQPPRHRVASQGAAL